MRSCIVFSSPRSGTHLVMKGLWLAGMTEVAAVTAEQWGYGQNGENMWWLLQMPIKDHYRFGAHVSDPGLVRAWKGSPLYGVYIERELLPQAKSLRAYLAVNKGQKITDGDAVRATIRSQDANRIWATQPRILSVWFDDLIAGHGWDRIFAHLDGDGVDIDAIVRGLPPQPGEPYYKNTVSTKKFYGAA